MRITNNMMVASTIRNMNSNLQRLAKAQEQMSSQCKIQQASDDPVVATRAVKYRNYVATTEQYQKNADDAASWQEVTEGALGDLGDVIKQVRDLTVQASSDTLSDSDRSAIAAEVEQLKAQAVDVMNTSYAGRYVFAGYATSEAPYDTETITVGTTTVDKTTFKGKFANLDGPFSSDISDADIEQLCADNASQMYQSGGSQSIKYNVAYGSQVTVNVEGQNVIGQGVGSNLFDSIDKLLLGLNGATSYKTASVDSSASPATVTVTTNSLEIDDVLDDLDKDLDRLSTARTELGSRMKAVEMQQTRLSNDDTTYTKLMSDNEDVDVAELSTEVSSAQSVYEASLSIGAKVISKTLVDYIG